MIADAESAIGFALPESFKWWLRKHGGAYMCREDGDKAPGMTNRASTRQPTNVAFAIDSGAQIATAIF